LFAVFYNLTTQKKREKEAKKAEALKAKQEADEKARLENERLEEQRAAEQKAKEEAMAKKMQEEEGKQIGLVIINFVQEQSNPYNSLF